MNGENEVACKPTPQVNVQLQRTIKICVVQIAIFDGRDSRVADSPLKRSPVDANKVQGTRYLGSLRLFSFSHYDHYEKNLEKVAFQEIQ